MNNPLTIVEKTYRNVHVTKKHEIRDYCCKEMKGFLATLSSPLSFWGRFESDYCRVIGYRKELLGNICIQKYESDYWEHGEKPKDYYHVISFCPFCGTKINGVVDK